MSSVSTSESAIGRPRVVPRITSRKHLILRKRNLMKLFDRIAVLEDNIDLAREELQGYIDSIGGFDYDFCWACGARLGKEDDKATESCIDCGLSQ